MFGLHPVSVTDDEHRSQQCAFSQDVNKACEVSVFSSIALLGKEFLGKVKKNFLVTSGRE